MVGRIFLVVLAALLLCLKFVTPWLYKNLEEPTMYSSVSNGLQDAGLVKRGIPFLVKVIPNVSM